MSSPEFDAYSAAYSEDIEKTIGVFGQEHDFFVRSKADILLPALAALNADTATLKVLDVGCGVGLVHRYIANALGELHGTDVSGASIDIARGGNPGVRYQVFDGVTLPYEDGSFDCAYAICVMHHVPVAQWQGFMKEMRRVVRPGGLLLVIEHNPLNPATQWVVRHAPMDANAVLLSSGTLRRLMTAAGARAPWVRYVLFLPFAGKLFRLIDRMLSRVPFGTQYVVGARV